MANDQEDSRYNKLALLHGILAAKNNSLQGLSSNIWAFIGSWDLRKTLKYFSMESYSRDFL